MSTYGIIGAGITGLTLALRLAHDGNNVQIWEADERVGGAIRSDRSEGWLAEAGPNSIQDSDASVSDLVEAVGLSDRLQEASTEAKRRYIVRGARPVLVPNSPLNAISTPLFSWKAKFGILGEPFRKPAADPLTDESLASFVRRRLGQEFLDYAINPMVGGIFAGNPEKLSVGHAFQKVKALEDDYGSLIKGSIGRMRERKRSGTTPHRKRVLSFPDGLSELTDAISRNLGDRLKTGHRVVEIVREVDSGYTLHFDGHPSARVHHLIFAGTTHSLENIRFTGFNGAPDALAKEVTYAPVHSVTLGFHKDDIVHPLDGFGVLVPEVEPFRILGCLFTSSIFGGRAPEHHATLTTFIGGMRRPELTELPDEELLDVVKQDLDALLGLFGKPVFTRIFRWSKAIPQYEVGYGDILKRMEAIENDNPGFEFAGNYKTGISLDACIRYGWNYKPAIRD
ncbi:MAG: protoporphyrinogen oxidase [Bacteroidetes bacterium]|nr:protoporphyrinogen oxidase [Bacteroidota bacterium]MCH8524390.1 protoporphyrinogen oxidase [Balneolales bacterium]